MTEPNAPAAGGTPQPADVASKAVAAATALLDRGASAAQTAAAPSAQPAPGPAGAPTPDPAPSGMKSAIEEMRAKREAAQREQQRESAYVTENRRLQGELDAMKRNQHFEDDPMAYAESRGWSKEQQLMYGKALLYGLAPDKADPEFRFKMFEDKQKRESARKEADQREQAAAQQQQANRNEMIRFAQSLEHGVMNFDAGSYPESEAWYGDNVEGYLRDLLSTAMRVADEATRNRQVADLSPQALAKALEAETAARLGGYSKRKQPAPAATPAAPPQSPPPAEPEAEQSLFDTTSTRNMSGSGAALPPARSDAERIQRAAAALFKTR